MDSWETVLSRADVSPLLAEALRSGLCGCRVCMHVREHPRPRTQKKWDRRYGKVSFTIPGSVILLGRSAISDFIRRVRKAARSVDSMSLWKEE